MDETTQALRALLEARERREPCALATVIATTGSIPRAVGAKMLVRADGSIVGSVGGGKFESLVIADARDQLAIGAPFTKSYPLHEGDTRSFGAICGGEVTVLIEPMGPKESLTLVGAGHCARAIASLARDLGWGVTVVDDRSDWVEGFPADRRIADQTPATHIASRSWGPSDALVLVSRSYPMDRDALEAAIGLEDLGYLGMIGSRKKVRQVFDELAARGIDREHLEAIHAPIGFDIGADSPAEIAVSVMAEVLSVLRHGDGGSLREKR